MTRSDPGNVGLAGVDEILQRAVEDGEVPGVVVAIVRSSATYVAVAGVAETGGAPMRRDTQFRIASMTKPLTAAAVLSLIDEGLLDLNGSIDELLPELADRRVLRRPDGGRSTTPSQRAGRSRCATCSRSPADSVCKARCSCRWSRGRS